MVSEQGLLVCCPVSGQRVGRGWWLGVSVTWWRSPHRSIQNSNATYQPVDARLFFMVNWSNCSEIESAEDKVSGCLVFVGSRVPLAALFENLKDGVTAREFTELFPGVGLVQVRAVLEFAAKHPLTAA